MLVKWKSEKEFYVLINGSKPTLLLMNVHGDVLDKQVIDLEFSHWMDYHPQNNEFVFSATKHGICNLFLLDLDAKALTQLNNDLADDLYPTFDRNGNIYFSKLGNLKEIEV